jgi:hypothetical protein
MQRDLDLIRKLLLAVEAKATGYAFDDIQIESYTREQIGYHSFLLIDAGYAQGIDVTTHDDTSPNWKILNLTSRGHDFVDAARNESIWRKGLETVKAKGLSVTLDLMKDVLIGLIKAALSSTPGPSI